MPAARIVRPPGSKLQTGLHPLHLSSRHALLLHKSRFCGFASLQNWRAKRFPRCFQNEKVTKHFIDRSFVITTSRSNQRWTTGILIKHCINSLYYCPPTLDRIAAAIFRQILAYSVKGKQFGMKMVNQTLTDASAALRPWAAIRLRTTFPGLRILEEGNGKHG